MEQKLPSCSFQNFVIILFLSHSLPPNDINLKVTDILGFLLFIRVDIRGLGRVSLLSGENEHDRGRKKHREREREEEG